MDSSIQEKLEREVPHLMQRHATVQSAYVFGSMASGFEHKGSDVDIAVRVDPRLSPEETFDLKLELAEILEDFLSRPVEVVVLNTASLKMIHQVMTTGRRLYAADSEEETAFRLQKRKEYFDFQHYLEDDRKALKAYYLADSRG